ncbi:hypothetical protein JTE90_015659 [Oedothorax gibbosus]|uniref:Eukaryotic translation initiation factor 3 subunit J n=1 Tax=Oedothorax gibbosus TaxID=931172 RepID=A0AAV6UH71_9ARAC|nr:hypothetical protein JTE90_015659 [Oedothorax gibbosus]
MADGEADWENEDFEPTLKKPILHTDRWEGEDEDDDVKDNWDDEEAEEKEKPEQNMVAMQPKKKKPLAQIIAEKEEKRRKELEEKQRLQKEQQNKDLTPQERLANKLKQQKLQEEADLQLAKETFGVIDAVQTIDQMKPSSKEDFDNFKKALVEKIQQSEESPHFVSFLEDLFRDICLNVSPEDIKKVTSSLTALANEKTKVLKAKAGKKKSKKGPSLNTRQDDLAIIDYGDEFDDCI